MALDDEYRPDPPAGLAWPDFVAARDRYRSRLAAGSEIARLERQFALEPDRAALGAGAALRSPDIDVLEPGRPPGSAESRIRRSS